MYRPRVIPVLLLQNEGLVKSVRFKNHRYIGDPLNAVKIFNDLKADELIFLDIDASKNKRLISLDLVKSIGEESNMPFGVGGGIKTVKDIQNIIANGAEKVIIGSAAFENPDFIKQATYEFGSSTIAVCLDVKKALFSNKKGAYYLNASKKSAFSPLDFALKMQDLGVGEIVLQSVDNDGMMHGYDIDLILSIAESLSISVVALGGAGNLEDIKNAYLKGGASSIAAGSFFVYQSKLKGVLISYPDRKEMNF